MQRMPANPTQAIRDLQPVMDDLLRTCMFIRKNQIGEEARHLVDEHWREAYDGKGPTNDQVEALLTDIYPWLWGPRSIMPLLISITDAYAKGSIPNGQAVYNALYIVHHSDRTGIIKIGYEQVYSRKRDELPEPEMWMAMVGL